MPDLLAHALVAYAIATVLSWRYGWLTPPYVTAVVAGAFVPDLAKAELVVSSSRVAALLGVPFDWQALHLGGGVLLSILAGVLVVASGARRLAALALGLGAGSHLVLDALLRTPSGYSYPVLWPLAAVRPPTPGLYLSTEPWPTAAAAGLAAAAYVATRWRAGG